MTKTIMILAIAAAFVAGSIGTGTIAYAGDDDGEDDGEDEPLLFSWTPDDTSSDPNNLIVVNGGFQRLGLLSDSTSDVTAEIEGLLKGDSENNSETTVTTTAGTTTITTMVTAKSQDGNDLEGQIQIDGETFVTKLSLLSSKITSLKVNEEFSGPTFSQALEQQKLTIPVSIEMCSDDDDKCFEGFGTIRREISETSSGGTTIIFATDSLEAEVIGDTGLFELKMSKVQRTIDPPLP